MRSSAGAREWGAKRNRHAGSGATSRAEICRFWTTSEVSVANSSAKRHSLERSSSDIVVVERELELLGLTASES